MTCGGCRTAQRVHHICTRFPGRFLTPFFPPLQLALVLVGIANACKRITSLVARAPIEGGSLNSPPLPVCAFTTCLTCSLCTLQQLPLKAWLGSPGRATPLATNRRRAQPPRSHHSRRACVFHVPAPARLGPHVCFFSAQKLDIIANDVFCQAVSDSGRTGLLVSEENDTPIALEATSGGNYLCAIASQSASSDPNTLTLRSWHLETKHSHSAQHCSNRVSGSALTRSMDLRTSTRRCPRAPSSVRCPCKRQGLKLFLSWM